MPISWSFLLNRWTNRFVQRCKGCRRFAAALRGGRKTGILLEKAWLCSAQCLENALVQTLAASGGGRQYTMPRLPRMPFRLLLLQNGVLSEADLKRAGAHAERTGVSLHRALLDLQLITDAELAGALAEESGCAFYALPPVSVALDAELPSLLAERCMAATVHSTPERVWIGFVHKVDHGLLRLMEHMTDRRTEPCFITAAYHERQLACRSTPLSQMLLPQAASLTDTAQAVVQHALRIAAEQVTVGRAGQTVWFRFHTGGGAQEDRFVHLVEERGASGERTGMTREKKLRVL